MILDDIVEKKKLRIKQHKENISLQSMKKAAQEIVKAENRSGNYKSNSFMKALKKPGLSIIGEYKKASPSKGVIVSDFDIYKIEEAYKNLGVDAFSILTEEDFFLGSDDYIKKINKISNTPILRKDFIIDFYQIYEAKVLGASAVLLIVAELKEKLKSFYYECQKYNLDALVEVHNKEELDIALEAKVDIIGINNRDLKTFVTTLDTTKKLIDFISEDKVIVSESGMHTIDDLRLVKGLGADAALVGEMFMRNIENENFKREFKRFKKDN